MMGLEELKKERKIVNEIDWTMTPEKAIDMYLEWGSGWTRGHDFVSYAGQESIYFVLFDWLGPQATLLRRSMEKVDEIAQVPLPENLFLQACEEDGRRPGVGVHAINDAVRDWLYKAIDA